MAASALNVRGTAGRVGRFGGRVLGRILMFVAIAALVVLAAGDAAGRFRIVPAPHRIVGAKYGTSDVIVVVPVPVQRLKVGDVIILNNKQEHALLRLDQIVDSDGPQVRLAGDPKNRIRHLSGTAWRVTAAVPEVGAVLGLIAGPVPGAIFVLGGFGLIAFAEMRRNRELNAPPPTPVVTA
jgi:hypothetical protein